MSPPAPDLNDGWRILVTDDNPTKLYALTQTLRDAGHCVFAAYDGQSALELVAILPELDLLITNTRLGVVNGPEARCDARGSSNPTCPSFTWPTTGRRRTRRRRAFPPCASRSRRTNC